MHIFLHMAFLEKSCYDKEKQVVSEMAEKQIPQRTELYLALRRENPALDAFEARQRDAPLLLVSIYGGAFEAKTPRALLLLDERTPQLRQALLASGAAEGSFCILRTQRVLSLLFYADAAAPLAQLAVHLQGLTQEPVTLVAPPALRALEQLPDAMTQIGFYADFARFVETDAAYIDPHSHARLQQQLHVRYPNYHLQNYERTIISAVLGNNLTYAEMLVQHFVIAHLLDDIEIFPSMRSAIANILRLVMALVAEDPRVLSTTDARYEGIIHRMRTCTTHTQARETLRDFFTLMAQYMAPRRHKSAAEMKVQSIMDYITKHYRDPMLSMNSICAQFHVSQSYLSHVFKEQIGINLSTYIQTLRIEEAKLLLSTSSLSIDEIARQVGYSGGLSLLKLFKKTQGITPSVYRQLTATLENS